VHYREQMLLAIKAIILSGSSANTGIFNIQNQGLRGFQLGDPRAHPNGVAVQLYSSEGGIELTFADARGPVGVTQPESKRIVDPREEIRGNNWRIRKLVETRSTDRRMVPNSFS
jgi:hypothetical protein